MAEIRSYGAWSSPITAERLTEGSIGLGDVRVSNGRLYWSESRPAEGGRLVVMTDDAGEIRQLTPEGFNVRTRVHEYGGASFAIADGALWFSNFADQRLYRQPLSGGPPAPITPEGYRYADGAPAPGGLVAVREDHRSPDSVRNQIVLLSGAADDPGTVLYDGADFVAYPRVSADGRRIAWIAWDFPAMPWDSTRLFVAEFDGGAIQSATQVAGGDGISIVEPQWRDDGALFWISDETGWWNLWSNAGGPGRPVRTEAAEYAGPLWGLGQSNYALMEDDTLVAAARRSGAEQLLLIQPGAATAEGLPLPFEGFAQLQRLAQGKVAAIGISSTESPALVVIDVAARDCHVIRRPSPAGLDPAYVAAPEAISFPSANGRIAHALFFAPRNAEFTAPADERPPLIVQAHGGPTASASGSFALSKQYWTTRGFAVVDVDYGGSTGYGRAYRELLNGQWGVVDVEDVIAAVRHLASSGRVDPRRVVIRGGSAGGFTVLLALAMSDVFAAGADLFGVTDLGALARDTHKFESRYLDGLIGPWPGAKEVYDARSPINHLAEFTAPLLILQGADDPIVPKNQAEMIHQALQQRGVPVALIVFEGEGHGFRKAETMIRAQEAELSFYAQVLGFTPSDPITPVEIENFTAG